MIGQSACRQLLAASDGGLSLPANFSWTAVGNVVYAGSQWGMLAVLAKLATPESVGQFSLGLAVTAPVMMFASLQLRDVQATDACDEYTFGDYVALRAVTTVLALVAIAVFTQVANYGSEITTIILAVAVAKAIESGSDIIYGLVQKHERMDCVGKSMVMRGLLSLIAFAIGVHLTGRVIWAIVGLSVAWALVLLGYDVRSGGRVLRSACPRDAGLSRTGARHKGSYRGSGWRAQMRLARLALPLGLVMLLVSLRANIPRYWVHRYLGEHGLGVYSALAYVQVGGTQVVNALGRAASPRLASCHAHGRVDAFVGLLLRLLAFVCLLGVVGVLLVVVGGRELLSVLYERSYSEYAGLFAWVMVAAGAIYVGTLVTYGMTATRHLGEQAVLFALVAGLTALACYWLVPTYGLQGAVAALLTSGAAQAVGGLLLLSIALRTPRRPVHRPAPGQHT